MTETSSYGRDDISMFFYYVTEALRAYDRYPYLNSSDRSNLDLAFSGLDKLRSIVGINGASPNQRSQKYQTARWRGPSDDRIKNDQLVIVYAVMESITNDDRTVFWISWDDSKFGGVSMLCNKSNLAFEDDRVETEQPVLQKKTLWESFTSLWRKL